MTRLVLFAGNDIAKKFIAEHSSLNIAYIVDNDVSKHGNWLSNVAIKPVSVLVEEKSDVARVVICSESHFNEIYYYLLTIGVEISKIWAYLPNVSDESYFIAKELAQTSHIASIPFSGARHLTESILASYRGRNSNAIWLNVTDGLHKCNQPICSNNFMRLVSRGGVTYSHLFPLEENIRLLASLEMKTIVLVRDPRQVIVSLVKYIDSWNDRDWPVFSHSLNLPDDYRQMEQRTKIDYQIEQAFPCLVTWLQDWRRVLEGSTKKNFLLINFDSCRRREDVTKSIVQFLDLHPRQKICFLGPWKGETEQVDSSTRDNWQTVFDSSQIDKVNELLPDIVSCFYGFE